MNKLTQRRAQAVYTAPTVDVPITTRTASRITGIPQRTIQAWAADGRICAERDGKLWLVSLPDIRQVAATLRPGKKPQCPGPSASSTGPKDEPPT